MTEHRDSPGIESGGAAEARVGVQGRFARLVESTTTRRVALPRLLLVASVFLVGLVLIVIGVSKLIRSTFEFVADQPDQLIRFAEIELVPAPDPWVIGGKSRILEQVRIASNLDETLPLLKLDPKEIEKYFRLCPWVKNVIRVEPAYRRLTIHLSYRKPVAVVRLNKAGAVGVVIDEEGVTLPDQEIKLTTRSPLLIHGISDPLIEIRGAQTSVAPRYGVRWDELHVPGAARLAEFLELQPRTTPSGRPVPRFMWIRLPGEPNSCFFLRDFEENWVKWDKAPGDEKLGEISSQDCWKMLLEWVDRHGPLEAKYPDYLQFTRSGAVLFRGTPRSTKPATPR